jgi:Protein of unknown function (DUF2783)
MKEAEFSDDRLGPRADDVYDALIAAHAGLGDAESAALNARLILVLANLIGDADKIIAAIEAAREHTVHIERDP